tara:strand:+ start:130 stop:906 length:777 start_codon:yes stop_codon:yes gene_type:complete
MSLFDKSDNVFNGNKIHFIAYGDTQFNSAKKGIFKQAKLTNWFNTISVLGMDDLDEDFKEEFKDMILPKTKWHVWKFKIILDKLKHLDDDEFLVYLDSGSEINIKGEERFKEYIELIKNNSVDKIISFQLTEDRLERIWNTNNVFNYFNVPFDGEIANSPQYMSGLLIMQKNKKVIDIFEKCLNAVKHDHNLITNNAKKYGAQPGFIDHRHDQAICSVVRKLEGSIVLPDETYYRKWNCQEALNKPFLCKRLGGRDKT